MRKSSDIIDFKKAYYSVRKILFNIPIEFVISTNLIKLTCLNENYSRFLVGKCLSDMFPGTNILRQRDILSSLLFNFAFVCVIRKVQEKQKGLKLKGTQRLPVYADNVNIFVGKHSYSKNVQRL